MIRQIARAQLFPLLSCRKLMVRAPSRMFLRVLLAGLFLVPLGACASNITRSTNVALTTPYFENTKVKAGNLSLTMTEKARKLAVENLGFNHKQLLDTVRRALEVNRILTEKTDASRPSIEIQVTSVHARSNFAAVMFGFLAGDDHIQGDIIVRAPGGAVVQRFNVSASYALGGLAGGQDSARFGWLYEAFAEHVVKELTGKSEEQAKPDELRGQ